LDQLILQVMSASDANAVRMLLEAGSNI